MLQATLTNGYIIFIDEPLRNFLNGQERGVWFDAETNEIHVEDRTKLKINSKQVVTVREI